MVNASKSERALVLRERRRTVLPAAGVTWGGAAPKGVQATARKSFADDAPPQRFLNCRGRKALALPNMGGGGGWSNLKLHGLLTVMNRFRHEVFCLLLYSSSLPLSPFAQIAPGEARPSDFPVGR